MARTCRRKAYNLPATREEKLRFSGRDLDWESPADPARRCGNMLTVETPQKRESLLVGWVLAARKDRAAVGRESLTDKRRPGGGRVPGAKREGGRERSSNRMAATKNQ